MANDMSDVVVRVVLIVRLSAINSPEKLHQHLIFN